MSIAVSRALALVIVVCIVCLLHGCDRTPWVDEEVLLAAPAVVAVTPLSPGVGMATVRGPRELLVSGHQASPHWGLGLLAIDGENYVFRVSDGIYDPDGAGGWLVLELHRPLTGTYRTFERDYVTPIPVGDPIFIVCARQSQRAAGRFNDRISVIAGRVLPASGTDPRFAEFLQVDAGSEPGCSGSPVYWWPESRTAPVEIGIVGGRMREHTPTGRTIRRAALVRRPYELVH